MTPNTAPPAYAVAVIRLTCDPDADNPYHLDCSCGHALDPTGTEDAARRHAEHHRNTAHAGAAVIDADPALPRIPSIHEDMFDHCGTLDEAQRAWAAIRNAIPRWHDNAQTRRRLACIAARRWDTLR